MEKFFFLDRNALSDVKRSVEGKNVDINRLKTLRRLDKNNHIVSGILAYREGQKTRTESSVEIKASVYKDAPYLDKFFFHAKTDTKIILELGDRFFDVFSDDGGKEGDWEKYLDFLIYVQARLFQPIASSKRFSVAQEICKKADELNFTRQHPVVVCSLSALYDNKHARGVLKPKCNLSQEDAQKLAYNTLNDLILIYRLTELQFECGPQAKVKLVTFDRSLENFLKLVRVESASRVEGSINTQTKMNIFFSSDIFSGVSEDVQNSLVELLLSGS
ncbi:hypothetical protein ACPV4O_27450 [Vibrio owensii]|uniref:hypothetical protein n=1 Tax=Vibrio owensii TaxID=696485 RepID=UPI0040697978